jgi:hypothetical protein
MAILSSLFQTGAPVQQVAGPTIATQKLPEELAPFYKDILGKAQALYDERTSEGFQPYQGPTIAEFTPEQQQAFTGLQGLVGSQAPVFQEGMDLTRAAAAPMTSEQLTQYMSPYQQAVTDIEKREATKQYESQVVPQLAAKAATTGSFGGSRQAILEGMAADTQQRLLSDIQAKGSQQAYQDAVQRFQADRTAAGQAGAQLATMAPQQFKAQLGELGALQTVGEQQQRQAQTALDEAFRQYQLERNYPYDTMSRYQSVVTGAPMGTTTFAQPAPPAPSTAQTLLGGLGTLVGTYGAFGGKLPNLFPSKKGGGIADTMVYAQDGDLISRYLESLGITLPRRGDNPFPAEITGDEIEFNYGDEKKQKIKEATDLQRKEMEERKARIANEPVYVGPYGNVTGAIDERTGDDLGRFYGTGPDAQRGMDVEGIQDGMKFGTVRMPPGYEPPDRGLSNTLDMRVLNMNAIDPPAPNMTNTEIEQEGDIVNQPVSEGIASLQPPSLNKINQMPDQIQGPTRRDKFNIDQSRIQAEENALMKLMKDRTEGRKKQLSESKEAQNRANWLNVAQLFSRLGSATPRQEGIMGVIGAGLEAADQTLPQFAATNAKFRNERREIQNDIEDDKINQAQTKLNALEKRAKKEHDLYIEERDERRFKRAEIRQRLVEDRAYQVDIADYNLKVIEANLEDPAVTKQMYQNFDELILGATITEAGGKTFIEGKALTTEGNTARLALIKKYIQDVKNPEIDEATAIQNAQDGFKALQSNTAFFEGDTVGPVKITSQKQLDDLPSGTEYIDTNGNKRIKS